MLGLLVTLGVALSSFLKSNSTLFLPFHPLYAYMVVDSDPSYESGTIFNFKLANILSRCQRGFLISKSLKGCQLLICR